MRYINRLFTYLLTYRQAGAWAKTYTSSIVGSK